MEHSTLVATPIRRNDRLVRLRARAVRAAARYDLFPTFSAKVRRLLYNPLGVLLLAAFTSILCGLFLHPQGFVLAGGALFVVALGVSWPWLTLRGLAGSISFDGVRTSERETVEVRLTLRNRLPWTVWGLAVRDGFGADPNEPSAGIASVPRRRTVVCRWPFVPARRGVYPLTAVHLTTGFPFGLWENRHPLSCEAPLIVWPRTLPVGPVPPVSGERQVEGNVSRSKVGTNGDVLGVRPYRRGDSPRRIHWGQTARHDRLIVCELQSNARPVIQLVLDTDCRIHAGSGTESSREWAIRIVASLAKGRLDDGAQVGLAWAGHDIPVASGQRQVHKILDALAALPELTEQPLAEVLACPKCRGFRDGLQVIVTTDRAQIHHGCGACEAEDQRWIVVRAAAFDASIVDSHPWHSPIHKPWLWIDSRERMPELLHRGWREAQHGS